MNASSLLIKTALLGGLLASLVSATPAIAQVGMSPLFLEAEASRGRAQGVVTLINTSDEPIRVRVYSEPFTYTQDGFVSLREDSEDLSPYLQFSPREAVIEPRSEQRIRLLGLFPPNLADGEYRAAIFAEQLADRSEMPVGAAIDARIGTTVYMRQGNLSADIAGVSAVYDGQTFELMTENRGQATTLAQLSWDLMQGGSNVASGEEVIRTVLADGRRKFPLSLPNTLAQGNYVLTGKLSWATLGEIYSHSFELPVTVP